MKINKIKIVKASSFTINGLRTLDNLFDAKTGCNTVPNSMDIQYFGFTIYMRPSQFLSLAATSTNLKPDFYKGLIEQNIPLGYPFLSVKLREDVDGSYWKVEEHEGRNRCIAIKEIYGDKVLIPVHIFPYGLRNRSLNSDNLYLPFVPEKGGEKIQFNPQYIDKNSKHLNLDVYESKPINKHSVLAVRWSSDMLRPSSPCELKDVKNNEDDIQELTLIKPQEMHVYNNQSIAPKGTRLMRRVN
jgi:hypothetical protein